MSCDVAQNSDCKHRLLLLGSCRLLWRKRSPPAGRQMDLWTWKGGFFNFRFYLKDNCFTVSISAIHQYESAIGVHRSPPSWAFLHPFPPLQVITEPQLEFPESSSKYIWERICFHAALSICLTLSFLPPPLSIVCSLCLHLHCCPEIASSVPSF